ncbi:MAG: hypothetical protein P8Y77_09230 [Nitrospirota bacterium]
MRRGMLVDVSIDGEGIDIDVADPFRYDLEEMYGRIKGFADSRGVDLEGADVKGLIPAGPRWPSRSSRTSDNPPLP